MQGNDLKELVKVKGKKPSAAILMEAMDEGTITPQDMSLRELWEAFVGPVGTTLEFSQKKSGYVDLYEGVGGTIDSSVYQTLAGKIISNMVIESYNRTTNIGDSLVQNYPTRLKYEKVPGYTTTDGMREVKEGENYEKASMGSKFVGTGEIAKKGRILAITEEAVYFDLIGQILNQAEQLGMDARQDKESTILKAVLGINACYSPSDVSTALYTTTPYLVASNPLIDWTSLETVEVALADMTDEEGNAIVVSPNVLLVPSSLKRTAQMIIGATDVLRKTPVIGTAGTTSQAREMTQKNPYMDAYNVISSPLIHNLQIAAGVGSSTARSSWWLGDPKRQFVWKEIWPLQVLKAKKGIDSEFNADVVAQFKIRYYGGIFAKDNKYFSKVTA